jgi:hypothetical protein
MRYNSRRCTSFRQLSGGFSGYAQAKRFTLSPERLPQPQKIQLFQSPFFRESTCISAIARRMDAFATKKTPNTGAIPKTQHKHTASETTKTGNAETAQKIDATAFSDIPRTLPLPYPRSWRCVEIWRISRRSPMGIPRVLGCSITTGMPKSAAMAISAFNPALSRHPGNCSTSSLFASPKNAETNGRQYAQSVGSVPKTAHGCECEIGENTICPWRIKQAAAALIC